MSRDTAPYAEWIGATDTAEEEISLFPALALAATLDDTETQFGIGSPLPPVWQWFYFLPKAPQSKLGPDGHPERGGFMPPIDLPRRMFAGARMKFLKPLVIGKTARRDAEILKVSQKEGRTGKLAFVTVGYKISQDGVPCIEEEQDIVYREPGAQVPAPTPVALPPQPDGAWTRTITPDPRLLFRFSALTFNAHRIHYDRPYAMSEEGYPGLVVHGPLTAIFLMELVRKHGGRPVASFSFRGQAPLFDLAPFRLVGAPTAPTTVELEAHGPDGKTAMSAVAELEA
jgi:3-methylfumaryl-CoA hydratase